MIRYFMSIPEAACLVIQAGAMSLPVVEKCGFERVCRIDLLRDPEVR